MAACTWTGIIVLIGMSSWFHRYLDLSDLTQFGWYMGLCTQLHGVHAHKLACLGQIMCSERSACSLDSIDILISLIWPPLAEIWACAHKHTVCMHSSLRAQVIICAQKGATWSPDSVDTLISLMWPNLVRNIACMHISLRAWVKLGFQIGLACSPDSIDILISLIRPHLAEIWACARKHTVCMHSSLHAQVILCAQKGPAWSPDSIDTLISLIGPNLAEIWA